MHEDWTLLKRLIWLRRAVGGGSAPILKTITGSLLHITDALARPANEFVAVLSPKQEGSGDPSPSNVRPISGWTGMGIGQCGKNLFSTSSLIYGSFISEDGVITSGTDVAYTEPISVRANQAYTLAFYHTSNGVRIRAHSYDKNGNWIRQEGTVRTDSIAKKKYTIPFTTSNEAAYVRLSFYIKNATEIQFEVGSATTYEAFHGTSLPIDWQDEAGTVYGGTLTTHEDGSADLISTIGVFDPYTKLSAFQQGNGNVYILYAQFDKYGYKSPINTDVSKCNMLKALSTSSPSTPSFSISSTGTFAVNGASGITDTIANWTNYVTANHDDNPILFYLELEAPVTYHFDNIGQLQMFLGENNIWTDASDDLTLTYYADGNVSDLEAMNTLLGGAYVPGDVSDRDALNILLGETT